MLIVSLGDFCMENKNMKDVEMQFQVGVVTIYQGQIAIIVVLELLKQVKDSNDEYQGMKLL